jgi:biotin operon repressor
MSVKIMGKVWELNLPANEKLVLLALSDHADHNGENAHPGNKLLAMKTGYSERQVQRIIQSLQEKNLIQASQDKGGRNLKKCYTIDPEKGDKTSSFSASKGRHIDTPKKSERVTSATQKGDICDKNINKERARVLTVHEPPIEPSIEPSILADAGEKTETTPANNQNNRDGISEMSPPPASAPPIVEAIKKTGKLPPELLPDFHDLMKFLEGRVKLITDYGKEAHWLSEILLKGFNQDQCKGCFDYLVAERKYDFVGWGLVAKVIGTWSERQEPKAGEREHPEGSSLVGVWWT